MEPFILVSVLKRGVIFLLLGLSFLVAAILLSVFAEAGTSYPTNGGMTELRMDHTATLLNDGRVLLTGGAKVTSTSPHFAILNTAEIYDPTTGNFTETTGTMSVARRYHSAVLLADGRVLITGGEGYLSSAEIYDPTTGRFTSTGALNAGRSYHASTLLPDGKVLITGGLYGCTGICTAAEEWNPATAMFEPLIAGPAWPHIGHDAILLPSANKVLLYWSSKSTR